MTFVDLFCGMGTIRMGFEQAGHKCVYSVEFDKHKREIYKTIFGSEPDASDIKTVRGTDIPISDCWCFGAPCQDFSVAGLRAGLDGERSGLVREVFRLIEEKEPTDRPEWLLYENVKGMLSSNNGWDFAAIQAEMGELGYDVQWQILNSKNFGVPQNRERVYTLGHLRTKGSRKVFPIGKQNNGADCQQFSDGSGIAYCLDTGYGKGITCNKAKRTQVIQKGYKTDKNGNALCLDANYYKGILAHQDRTGVQVKQIGNVMPTATRDNPNQGRVYDPTGLAPCLNKMEGGGREPLITEPCAVEGVNRGQKDQNGRRFKEPGEPMFTLTKQDIHGIAYGVYPNASPNYQRPPLKNLSRCLKADGNHPAGVLYSNRIRRLTPRECMRLQGVPDYITDKLIAAGISDTQMYRAAGDACTVNVIYEIAKRLEVTI